MPSSTTTPVWGPQLPRLKRVRQRNWKVVQVGGAGQSRNGVTKEENPWVEQGPIIWDCATRCEDTIRNPKFEPFRQSNFYDDGGPLKIRKGYWTVSSEGRGVVTPWLSNTRVRYGFHAINTGETHNGYNIKSLLPDPDDADLSAYNAKAFAMAKPTNPLIDLGVILAEIRDFPRLIKGRIEELKDISDWYLAIQFGWKPLLADIQAGIKTIVDLDKQFQFLIRNNGKPVRRRVTLERDSGSGTLRSSSGIGITRNTYVDWPGRSARTSAWKYRVTHSWARHVWASGEFIFFLGDTSLPTTEAYIKHGLLGLRVTPSVIWNAMPWSWLIDWISNVGDVLDVLSEQVAERTVARYLYVMGETHRKYTWSGTDGWYSGTISHIYETKAREACHPFGLSFGASLSPRQYTILAALGAQRF